MLARGWFQNEDKDRLASSQQTESVTAKLWPFHLLLSILVPELGFVKSWSRIFDYNIYIYKYIYNIVYYIYTYTSLVYYVYIHDIYISYIIYWNHHGGQQELSHGHGEWRIRASSIWNGLQQPPWIMTTSYLDRR
jgi:hypothetical protein